MRARTDGAITPKRIARRAWRRTRRLAAERHDRVVLARLPAAVARRASDPAAQAQVARAFTALYQPREEGELPSAEVRAAIVDQFHRLYYHASAETWRETSFRGVPLRKCALDIWIYHELLCEIGPDLIIESGTAFGGSAWFFADLCDTLGRGRVVSIDIEETPDRPAHDRIAYLHGSSLDPGIRHTVGKMAREAQTVLVVLDSDHRAEHVRAELDAYAPLVTDGSYLVVEDTNINGHPVLPSFGPGPTEALADFLAAHPEFSIDRSREKFLLTFFPGGFLRRGAPRPVARAT